MFIHKNVLEALENEVKELREENVQLHKQKCEAESIIFTKLVELGTKITDELELTPVQAAKVSLILSIEYARLNGVPEDKIIHNREELDKFFMSEES